MFLVGLEPSCTAVLRSDAVELLPDPSAEEVTQGVFTLAELLTQTDGWTSPDLGGVDVVAQPHCHQASVVGWDADAALLVQAGAGLKRVGGCCGLAATSGSRKDTMTCRWRSLSRICCQH